MISFAPTSEQEMVRDMLETLARDVLRPAAKTFDEEGALGNETLEALAATGMIELALDPSSERMRTSNVIALEALAAADAAPAVALAAALGYVRAVMDQGTAEQIEGLRAHWSGGGFRSAAVLVHEPGFDFDPVALKTRVRRDGSDFVLNGIKGFVPRAADCRDLAVVAASQNGLDVYLVPADAPGIKIMEPAGTLGLKSLALAEIRFDEVRLPASARLGGENGSDVQMLIDSARTATAAILTGVAGAVLDHLVPYLKDRVAHGSALAQKQSVAFRLADMSIDVPSMRWMTWWAASALDKGRNATREARLTQLHCAEQALWITDEGVQLMGGHGYLRANPVERWYRDVRTLAALEGVTGL